MNTQTPAPSVAISATLADLEANADRLVKHVAALRVLAGLDPRFADIAFLQAMSATTEIAHQISIEVGALNEARKRRDAAA